MDEAALQQLLTQVAEGTCTPDDAVHQLRRLPFADLGFARVDHHRNLRQGMAEAVYGPGKTPEQCAAIVLELLDEPGGTVLLTRANEDQTKACVAATARGDFGHAMISHSGPHATLAWRRNEPRSGDIVIMTAGTADLPVADECNAVLSALGFSPHLVADCGVAGVHRLLASADLLADADVVIVVAGMEGALASVVGGITSAPVIAVPTSAGYGAAFEGVTALLAMLASCASGVTVVGIDNGFGAACAAARLLP